MHSCNPSIQESETGGFLSAWGLLVLHSGFWASLGYLWTLYLKRIHLARHNSSPLGDQGCQIFVNLRPTGLHSEFQDYHRLSFKNKQTKPTRGSLCTPVRPALGGRGKNLSWQQGIKLTYSYRASGRPAWVVWDFVSKTKNKPEKQRNCLKGRGKPGAVGHFLIPTPSF